MSVKGSQSDLIMAFRKDGKMLIGSTSSMDHKPKFYHFPGQSICPAPPLPPSSPFIRKAFRWVAPVYYSASTDTSPDTKKKSFGEVHTDTTDEGDVKV